MRLPNAPPGLPARLVPALRGTAPAYIRTGMRFTFSLHCCADTLAKEGARANCTAARSRPSWAWPHSTATVASSKASAPGTHAVGGGGRAQVRTALYMATLTATRYSPVIRRFFPAPVRSRQTQNGRPHRGHAQCAHHSQCHDQSPETLAPRPFSLAGDLTSNTVALSNLGVSRRSPLPWRSSTSSGWCWDWT